MQVFGDEYAPKRALYRHGQFETIQHRSQELALNGRDNRQGIAFGENKKSTLK
jgi:hypothetical protein